MRLSWDSCNCEKFQEASVAALLNGRASLNALNTTQTIVIGNNNGATSDTLMAGNLANSFAPNAANQIYVEAGGSMTIVGCVTLSGNDTYTGATFRSLTFWR